MMKVRKSRRAGLLSLALLLIGVAACDTGAPTPNPTATQIVAPSATERAAAPTEPVAGPTDTAVVAQATVTPGGRPNIRPSARYKVQFAAYKVQSASVNPIVQAYTVEPGLANVVNKDSFQLSPGMISLLEQNAFAAQFNTNPDFPHKQFYQLYEDGRYGETPVFVSTDSVLHVYHLMFDKILRTTETKYLANNIKELTAALLEETKQDLVVLRFHAAAPPDGSRTGPAC